MNLIQKAWGIAKKQLFSVIGSITSVIFYVYNMFKPSSIVIPTQSGIGEAGGQSLVLPFFWIAVFLMALSIGVFVYRHRRGLK